MSDRSVVLVVDDSCDMAESLVALLELEGHQAREAHSGERALVEVEAAVPDLILLDVRMPGMDGFEVCRRLKQREASRNIPIIFLTGATEPGERVAGLQLGAVDYITKPFEKGELLARVHTHLELSRLRRQVEERAAELEQANQKLRDEFAARQESERRFWSVVDGSPDVIYVQTKKRFAYVNPAAMRLFGATTAEQLLGEPILERYHPDHRAAVPERMRLVNEERRPVPSLEQAYLRLDGTPVFVEVSAVPVTYDGVDGALVFARDVTARKRAEEERRRSEEKYRQVVEHATEAIVVVQDGRFKLANEATARLVEVSLDRLQEQPFLDFIHPDDQSFVADRHRRCLAGEQTPILYPFRTVTAAGAVRWVEISTVRVEWEGRPATLNFFTDFTERRQAEEALRESEERFRTLVENQGEGVGVVDPSETFVYANPAAERIFGVPPGTLLGRNLSEFSTPAELERFQGETKLRATGKDSTYEASIRRLDGEVRQILVTATPRLDGVGRFSGCFGIFMDVTERKRAEAALRESEERFRTLVESLHDDVATTDLQGRFTSMRLSAPEPEGRQESAFIGKTASEVYRAELGAQHEQVHRRVLGGEHVLYEWQLGLGSKRQHRLTSSSPLRDARGAITGTVSVTRDITELKTMQDQLLLSERLTSMGTLAAGVAHEINNPLVAVMANLDFSLRALGVNDAAASPPDLIEIDEALRESLEGAERVRQIVRDLKVFSRPDEERRDLVDVRRLMDSSLRMAWNEIRHRAQLLKLYEETPTVLANEARLGQVFLNLLINAAQAMREGQADRNTIRIVTRGDPAGRAVVEVHDTGSGIAPEVMAQIFDPFYTTKPVGVGTGLGLAICRRIVAELGGEIGAESTLGQGSCFRVTLPAAAGRPVDAAVAPVAAGRRGLVLVIDDDAAVLMALSRMLATRHEVVADPQARHALDRIAAGARFDLILCDVMMPEMTGMDFFEELSRISPDDARRMVFLTGGAFTSRAREFLDRVANPRLEKPFEAKTLLALVDRLLA
jgi:PAS domain S-box-containing protein